MRIPEIITSEAFAYGFAVGGVYVFIIMAIMMMAAVFLLLASAAGILAIHVHREAIDRFFRSHPYLAAWVLALSPGQ